LWQKKNTDDMHFKRNATITITNIYYTRSGLLTISKAITVQIFNKSK